MSDRLRLDDQLCFALYVATDAVVRAYRPLLRRIGLTYPQYLVMLALWQDGPTTPEALAERLAMAPAALRPLLDRLEAADFVIRLRDPEGAVARIAPTRAGAELESAAAQAQAEVQCGLNIDESAYAELRERVRALAGLAPGAA